MYLLPILVVYYVYTVCLACLPHVKGIPDVYVSLSLPLFVESSITVLTIMAMFILTSFIEAGNSLFPVQIPTNVSYSSVIYFIVMW